MKLRMNEQTNQKNNNLTYYLPNLKWRDKS